MKESVDTFQTQAVRTYGWVDTYNHLFCTIIINHVVFRLLKNHFTTRHIWKTPSTSKPDHLDNHKKVHASSHFVRAARLCWRSNRECVDIGGRLRGDALLLGGSAWTPHAETLTDSVALRVFAPIVDAGGIHLARD